MNNILEEIKNDLQKFKHEDLKQCPYCSEVFEWDDVNYNPEESTYICPICRETVEETDLQSVNFIDYIEEVFSVYKGEKENGKY